MTVPSGQRTCPHCQAAIPLDLSRKCAKCRRPLPAYCFGCYAALPKEDVHECPACRRPRWVVGDFADLPCAVEGGTTVRQHRYMTTVAKGGKVLNEWRCMKCLTDETRTDAFSHFPARV